MQGTSSELQKSNHKVGKVSNAGGGEGDISRLGSKGVLEGQRERAASEG